MKCERFGKKMVEHCFKGMVRCTLVRVVGSYFFEEPTVTGANYLEVLGAFAINFKLQGIPAGGSPSPSSLVQERQSIPDAWIGRGCPTA